MGELALAGRDVCDDRRADERVSELERGPRREDADPRERPGRAGDRPGSWPEKRATVATSLPSPRMATARATSVASSGNPRSRETTVRETARGPRSVIAGASPAVGERPSSARAFSVCWSSSGLPPEARRQASLNSASPGRSKRRSISSPIPSTDRGRGLITTDDGSAAIPAINVGSTPGSVDRWPLSRPMRVPSRRWAR
jgi:hypothetical protein